MERVGRERRAERSVRRISREVDERESHVGEVPTLGAFVRRARETLGMSREELGEPGPGEVFVAAIERGAVRPSLAALKALAERLNLPVEKLLGCRTRLGRRNLRAYERDLAYQLDLANWMLYSNRIGEGLACIAAAEAHAARYVRFMSPQVTYRIPYLRGKAHHLAQRPAESQPELEKTLRLLSRISGAGKRVESSEREENIHALIQTHKMLGNGYYRQGQLQKAQDHHLLCRRLIAEHNIKNPGLRLGIYRNLGNDYWASGNFPLAIATYKEALTLFDDLSDPQRQAGVHWGLSMSYKELDDLVRAAAHARQAVSLYMEAGAWGLAATMRLNLAEVLIENERYQEAEENLNMVSRWLKEPVPAPISPISQILSGSDKPEEGDSAETGGDGNKGEDGDVEVVARNEGGATGNPEAGQVEVERQEILLSVLYTYYGVLAWKQHDLGRATGYIGHSVEWGEQAVANTARLDEAGGYAARTLAEALKYSAQIHEDVGDKETCDRQFERALEVISTTEFAETYKAVASAYAAVLEAREDYKGAVRMYRLAASKGSQAANT